MTRFLYDRLRAEVAELRRRVSVVASTVSGGGPHASNHENGGSDEIDVTGLTGLLATPQTPAAHAATHSDGGGDDVSVLNLAGYPGGGTTFLRDDGTFAAATAGAHATSHQNGGSDEINVAGLSGLLADDQNPTAHASDHQNGGGDEISVAGLSGMLADAQLVGVRKNSTGSTFTRQRLNFIEGSNVTLTVADDVGNGEVDITIESVGAGSPSGSGIDELTGHVTAGPGSGSQIATLDEAFRTRLVTVYLAGAAGADITTGVKASVAVSPLPAGAVTDWRITSPDTGNIVIDVLKGTFSAFPTLTSMTAGDEPELSSANKDEGATVGWTAVAAGDVLSVDVVSCSGITDCTLTLTLVQP